MKILVTGGRGYLGGRIARNFLDLGHTVSITSRQPAKESFPGASIKFLDPDWSSSSQLAKACEGIDVVIHAAGINADDCLKNPELAIEFNGKTSERLAIASEQVGVKKFIYFSTAHVYCDPLVNFLDEDSPTQNEHPYATSHLLGEKGVLYSQKQGDMQRCVLRLSNVYGKPEDKNTNCWRLVVNDMARQVAEQSSIILKTSGKQKRDFVSISDLLDFITGITKESFRFKQPQIINFGSGESLSLLDMASLISEISLSIFNFLPLIQTGNQEILTENLPLEYSSKFESVIKQFRKNNVQKEIHDLLTYSKNNFQISK
jgi:UDP-glucose 4-epimerase